MRQHQPNPIKCPHGYPCYLEPVPEMPGWVQPIPEECSICEEHPEDRPIKFKPGETT